MQYLKEFNLNPPIEDGLVASDSKTITSSLPDTYYQFLREGNGGEGFVGETYLILWRLEELEELNEAYKVSEYAPGFLLFGSNGGGEAFAFDVRESPTKIGKIPFVGMDKARFTLISDDFEQFLQYLFDDR